MMLMKLRAITCYCFLRSIVAGKNIFYEYKITRISGFDNKFPKLEKILKYVKTLSCHYGKSRQIPKKNFFVLVI